MAIHRALKMISNLEGKRDCGRVPRTSQGARGLRKIITLRHQSESNLTVDTQTSRPRSKKIQVQVLRRYLKKVISKLGAI